MLAALLLLAILAACAGETTISTPEPTLPVATVAPTEVAEPTQAPTATPTSEPTLPPTQAIEPTDVPSSTPTPAPSPTSQPQLQPQPTLTPVQNLLDGLSWTSGFIDASEQQAISAISTIAELDADQGQTLADSDWVANGITDAEASALETLSDITAMDLDLGTALTNLHWLQDSSIAASTKVFWLESFLSFAPYPDSSRVIVSWPWIEEGPTTNRRVVQRNLGLIAESNEALLAQLVSQTWLQDDISQNEAIVVQELAKLDTTVAQSLFEAVRFADVVTDSQATLFSAAPRITDTNPDLLAGLLNLAWAADGLSENEELAIALMEHFDQTGADIITTIPWFTSGPLEDQEINSIKAFIRLRDHSPELSAQVADMDFFRNSVERHDNSAVDAIKTLNQDPEDWALLSKQSWYQDGVSDDEAVVLTVLPGQAENVPTDYQSLVDNRFYMEKTTEPLPRSGSVDLYLVRFLEHPTESATMTHLRSAVLAIENYMGFPLPVKEIIMLFSTNIDAGGINYGSHFTLDLSEDANLPQLIEGGIVHEISHFYRVADSAWFGEGTANFLATHVGFELYNQEVAPRSNRSTCPNDVTNITEIEAAYPGFYPEPIAHRFCYHNYGEKIIRGLKAAMGDEPFHTAWKEIFQTGIEEDRIFTDEEIYQLFLKHAPTDRITRTNQVFVQYHGGDFVTSP